MRKIILQAVLLLSFAQVCHATTWYVRTDGGSNTRCTGTTNAADPGSGTAQPCSFNHPYQLLSYSGAWTSLTPGDTIQFEDVGPYYMGQTLNGIGTNWHTQIGGICTASGVSTACHLPVLPSNVSVLGKNAGSCHTTTHTGLVNPTVLSGINDAFYVLSVQGTNNDTISCIEITQPDTCTYSGSGTGKCVQGTNNFVGSGGGGGLVFEYGTAQGPSNLTLQDVAVVGIATSGILGSHLNTTGTDTLTASDVYIIGNGNAGWNADGGSCGTSCESVGTMNLSYVTIDWNGCVVVEPYVDSMGSNGNAYNYCYDDTHGGYGDGFVMIAAGDVTLNVTHSFFRHNTQDGFDSLHLGDDLTHNPITNISTSWAEGNMGQTFKLGAGSAATAINNVSIANCRVLGTAGNFPLNPTGWNAGLGDFCRASGDQWVLAMKDGETTTLQNNTSVGYPGVMYDVECAASATCTTHMTVIFQNNITKGYPDPGNSGIYPAGFYINGISNPISNTGSLMNHNLWNTLAGSYATCPTVTGETSCTSSDPLLAAESNINAISPALTSSSPARGAGVTLSGITLDYNGATRPSPPSIGAFEFISATGSFISPGVFFSSGTAVH